MGEQGEAPTLRRPWARHLTVLVAVLVAASAFVVLTAPFTSAGSEGPSVSAVGPRHELLLGTVALTVHTLNPFQYTLTDEFFLVGSIYSFLWSYGPTWNVEPDLALRWNQVSSNPTIWEFWLTKNAYFVDPRECTKDAQGHIVDCAPTHQVTAADVKFTFDYIKSFGKQTSYFQVCVEKFVKATVDPLDKFHITLEFEGSYALGFISAGCLFIVPEYIWRAYTITDPNVLPIGSGPYLARVDPAAPSKMLTPPPIILDRNPIWYGRETLGRQVFPDTIRYISYTTQAAMAVDLTLGKLDGLLNADAPTWTGFLATKPGIIRQSIAGGFVAEQAINVLDDDLRDYFASISSRPLERGHTHPLLREQVVRNAIHMATDRQKMITNAWQGLASPADTLMPPFNQWHIEIPPYSPVDSDGDGLGFDFGREEFPEGPEGIAQGREYLRRAGWRFACATGDPETGVEFPLCRKDAAGRIVDRLEFSFHTFNTEPWWEVAARGVVEDAEDVGIQLNMILVNPSAMFNLWYKLDYEVWLWDWIVTPVVDTSIYLTVQTCAGMVTLDNDNGFCQRDPVTRRWTFDDKYNQTLTETDFTRRKALSDELWKTVYDFGSYNLPFYLNQLYAFNEVRWTNWGDWRVLKALPPDVGNPVLIGMQANVLDQKPPQFTLANVEGASGKPVQFSVAAIDPEGGPLRYRWDFDASSEPGGTGVNNDGINDNDEQATTATPTFIYSAPGTYGVSLRVFEDGGDFFTTQRAQAKIVLPAVGPPKITAVSFSPSNPTSLTGDTVTFAASANDPNGLALTYTWNFGDGSPPVGPTTDPVVGHAYSLAGTYTASLHVVNSDGRPADSSTIVQVVNNVAPVVAPLESKAVVVGVEDTFVAFASDANSRDVLTYTWDFGDESPIATGNPVSHTYTSLTGATPRTLTVSVSDGHGHATTSSASINVVSDRNTAPSIGLTASTASTFTGVPVELTGTVTDAQGNVLDWQWDFDNNGVIDKRYTTPLVTPGQAVIRTETHAYTAAELQAGRATAKLTITDVPPSGAPKTVSTSVTIRVAINNAPSLSTILQTPDAILPGQALTLTSTSNDLDGDRLSFTWTWDDGTTPTTGQTGFFGGPIEGTHTYAASGDYSVALVVTDGKGGEARRGFIVTVLFQQIQAAIETRWTQLALGQTMDLTVVAKVAPNIGASGAAVTLSATPGLTLTASSGITDANGRFSTTVRGAALGDQSVTATASKAPHTDGTAVRAISVISALSMTLTPTSDSTEMMSFETATVRVKLTDVATTAGVTDGLFTIVSPAGGNISAVRELGGGEYEFQWDAPRVSVQTFASLSLSAKVGGYTDARGRVVILLDPNMTGTDHTLFLIVEPEKFVLTSGETISVTVFVFTIEGFVVRGSTVTLRMLVPIGTLSPVTDRLNGVYTFTYTAPIVTSTTGVSIRIDAIKLGYNAGFTRLGLQITP